MLLYSRYKQVKQELYFNASLRYRVPSEPILLLSISKLSNEELTNNALLIYFIYSTLILL